MSRGLQGTRSKRAHDLQVFVNSLSERFQPLGMRSGHHSSLRTVMTPRNGLWLLVLGLVHSAAAASEQQVHSKVGLSILRPQMLHAVPSALKHCREGSAESDMVSVMLAISQSSILSVCAAL